MKKKFFTVAMMLGVVAVSLLPSSEITARPAIETKTECTTVETCSFDVFGYCLWTSEKTVCKQVAK